MDAIVKRIDPATRLEPRELNKERPSREEAEEAVRTLIRWAGDDPDREGLADTPKRVAKAYEEFFAGYTGDPGEELSRTFEEVEGYSDIVLVRDIDVDSHCEHHMVPIVGRAHIAYLPTGRVVGLSKIARLVDIYSKRLQTQETMTVQIADAIEEHLEPRGVAVMIDAIHHCMTLRGVKRRQSRTITTQFRGEFATDRRLESRFLRLVEEEAANAR